MNRIAAPGRLPLLLTAGLVTVTLSTSLSAQDPPQKVPLRLDNWLGTPDYLRVSGSHRTRFESLNGQFRANPALRNTEDQLFNRSIIRIDYTRNRWGATLEGLDARAFNTKMDAVNGVGSFANTTTVNTADVLQANVNYDLGRLGDGTHSLTIGRYTMDIGSRRLSARNRFRNTINSFNGFRWDYRGDDGHEAGAFWNMPTWRRPDDRMMLVDNEHDWDKQSLDYQFYGAHYTRPVDDNSTGQAYLLGTSDERGNGSDNLVTAGVRYFRPARPGHLFGEFEGAYQFGDRGTEDVTAWFAHASIGYQCNCAMKPTIRLAYDIATGDDDPNDGDYNRFNTLFGARRFEYGPTGIYGAIGRRNISSPEIRLSLNPCPTTWFMIGHRFVGLESDNDQWAEAQAGDRTGAQGANIGNQTEVRLRWDPCAQNLRFELGGVYLSGNRFRDEALPNRSGDTKYFYFETILTF